MRLRSLFATVVLAFGILIPGALPASAALTCVIGGVTYVATINASGGITNGTAGADVIRGTNGNDIINGLAGNDVICGRGGNDVINGGDDSDLISGDSGADDIKGGAGADQIFGGTQNDRIDGQEGGGELTATTGMTTSSAAPIANTSTVDRVTTACTSRLDQITDTVVMGMTTFPVPGDPTSCGESPATIPSQIPTPAANTADLEMTR